MVMCIVYLANDAFSLSVLTGSKNIYTHTHTHTLLIFISSLTHVVGVCGEKNIRSTLVLVLGESAFEEQLRFLPRDFVLLYVGTLHIQLQAGGIIFRHIIPSCFRLPSQPQLRIRASVGDSSELLPLPTSHVAGDSTWQVVPQVDEESA